MGQITNSREVPNVRLGDPPNCHRFAFIAPAEQEGHDRRIFECLICNRSYESYRDEVFCQCRRCRLFAAQMSANDPKRTSLEILFIVLSNCP
jgi:hypothetical protein